MAATPNHLTQQDYISNNAARSNQQEQVDKLKQAAKLRNSTNASPDPLAFINMPVSNGGQLQKNSYLEKVQVLVDEDGTTIVGKYKLGRDLGKGTFGKVRVGTHLLTDEKVAVKILEKDKIIDSSDVDRVSREIHILKILRHPVVVQMYEIIESEKELFLIMEYARGGELFDFIVSHKRVREKEASRFLWQIISGIEYLHKLGICHRDLKPENLLMDDYNNIKIVDFGLSNTYKPGETLQTACGSPCYAAPEMVAGKRYAGLPADIWSCGVILYAMVCGYLPFEDPKTNMLYKKILNADYTIPEFVSEDCADLIRKILNTDPDQRYTMNEIKEHKWMQQIKNVKEYSGIVIGKDPIPLDQAILEQVLEKCQLSKTLKEAKAEVQMNRHNGLTTAYYLTLKRFLRQGGKSIADITKYNADHVQTLLNQEQISQIIVARPQQQMRNTSDYFSYAPKPALDDQVSGQSQQQRFSKLMQKNDIVVRGATSNNVRNRSQALTDQKPQLNTPSQQHKNQIHQTEQTPKDEFERTPKTGQGYRTNPKVTQPRPLIDTSFIALGNYSSILANQRQPNLNATQFVHNTQVKSDVIEKKTPIQKLQQTPQSINLAQPQKLARQFVIGDKNIIPQVSQQKQSSLIINQQQQQDQDITANYPGQRQNQPPGDFSYMYFTPRDFINFKKPGATKFQFTSQQPNIRRPQNQSPQDQNYIVAQSPLVQGAVIAQQTMGRRPKIQQTFFKPPPKFNASQVNPLLSKSVNININEQMNILPSQRWDSATRNSITEMPTPDANPKRHFVLQSHDFSNYELGAAINSRQSKKSRMHQATANSRFRQTSYNITQSNIVGSEPTPPINVINNSLNITIYSGNNTTVNADAVQMKNSAPQEQPTKRAEIRSRTKAYFTDQLVQSQRRY